MIADLNLNGTDETTLATLLVCLLVAALVAGIVYAVLAYGFRQAWAGLAAGLVFLLGLLLCIV